MLVLQRKHLLIILIKKYMNIFMIQSLWICDSLRRSVRTRMGKNIPPWQRSVTGMGKTLGAGRGAGKHPLHIPCHVDIPNPQQWENLFGTTWSTL